MVKPGLPNTLRSTERHSRECEAVRRIETLLEQLTAYADDIPGQRTLQGQDVFLDVTCYGLRCVVLRTAADVPRATLSPREQEIARMVAKGYPNKTIAAVLEISTWTVNTHLRRMFAKLGVRSRAALIAKWMGSEITQPDRVARKAPEKVDSREANYTQTLRGPLGSLKT